MIDPKMELRRARENIRWEGEYPACREEENVTFEMIGSAEEELSIFWQ
jgi:hypothetical protein